MSLVHAYASRSFLLSPDVYPGAYSTTLGSVTGISNSILNGTLDFKMLPPTK